MQENIQAYIDAYSNFILNHLLLAENPTGVNIIQLDTMPRVKIFPSAPGGLRYENLEYLFKNHVPIKLGVLSLAPSYEIALYFLCTEPKFNLISSEVFFNSYYQLTGSEYLVMAFHNQDTPVTTSTLEASSLITCSLNLGLQHDYTLYKTALEIVRQMVIRFYAPQLSTHLDAQPPEPTNESTAKGIVPTTDPQSVLTTAELDALSDLFNTLNGPPS